MPSGHIAGTFAHSSAITTIASLISDVLLIPSGPTTARLYLTGGLDANNRVRAQKSTDSGVTWANQVLYNTDQNGTSIAVAAGEQWRLTPPNMQAGKNISYKLTIES